jgi:peptidoglycan/xylan/chitin deacetylase (PgdA/CDA1 family)
MRPRLRLRRTLRVLLERTGGIDVLLRARARGLTPWITALTWHRLADPAGDPFDPGVVDATPDEFAWQIELIHRHFSVIGIDDVLRFVQGDRALPPNPVLLTFDDGYRSCHDVALPILLRFGARAAFFVSTDHVGRRGTFWWDRVAYVLRACRRARVELDFPCRLALAPTTALPDAIRAVGQIVKTTPGLDLERYLCALAEACGVPWSPAIDRDIAEGLVMSWDQVRALRDAGMDVQSHGRTHRVLQTLGPRELASELRGAREDLEAQLGEKVRALSFPNGGRIVDEPAIVAAVRDAGYEIAFANERGVIPLRPRPHRFDLRRLSLESGLSPTEFRTAVAIPFLA